MIVLCTKLYLEYYFKLYIYNMEVVYIEKKIIILLFYSPYDKFLALLILTPKKQKQKS